MKYESITVESERGESKHFFEDQTEKIETVISKMTKRDHLQSLPSRSSIFEAMWIRLT